MLSGPRPRQRQRRPASPACGRRGRLTFEPTACIPARPTAFTAEPGRAPACPVRAGRRLLPPRTDQRQRQHQVLSDSGKYCARSAPRCARPNFRVSGADDRLGPGPHFKCAPARGAGEIGGVQFLDVISAHPPARRIGRVSENFPAPTPALRVLRRRACILRGTLAAFPSPRAALNRYDRAQVMAWHCPGHICHRQSGAWASPWCSASLLGIHPKLDASQAQRYRSVSETAT